YNVYDHGDFSAFVIPDGDEDDFDQQQHENHENRDHVEQVNETQDYYEPQIQQEIEQNEQPSISFDNSIYSVNTPGLSRPRPSVATKPLIPLNFNDTLGENLVADQTLNTTVSSNKSPIHVTAALKKNQKKTYILAKPPLIKPESPSIEQPNLRRSGRTRVRTLRKDLGEEPVYEFDENGLPYLVGVTEVEIKNPRAQKYLTADVALQNQREKELKKGNKKRKEFAKHQREIEDHD
uniref:Uncharacterized protein n=1 Tax=Panagrolaimus sp. ES5 TaxID=591445 RepID=A0AC34FRN6_9BILA